MATSSRRSRLPLRYVDAGVDVPAAEANLPALRAVAERASRPEVLGGLGAFAGLFHLGTDRYRDPVLVSSTDSVGTKLLIASALGRYVSIGQDLVNHCVNDILTAGAEPLFFLDYLATVGLEQKRRIELVAGVAAACEANGVALLGGETADLPDLYRPGDYDIAGFIVGVVERDAVIDGTAIKGDDVLVGIPSTGLQTNGYSLVRQAFGIGKGLGGEHDRTLLEQYIEKLDGTLGDALLTVHGSFLEVLRPLLPMLRGIAHITGGGLPGNVGRILPEGLAARINVGSWAPPPLFVHIQEVGSIEDGEMFRTFNMGVGMVVVVAPGDAEDVIGAVPGSWRIGEVVHRLGNASIVDGLPD